MPIGVMLGSAQMAGRTMTSDGLWEPLGELDAHLEAHGVDEEVRDRLRLLGDDFAVDVRLVQGRRRRSSWPSRGFREAIGHRAAGVFVGAAERRRAGAPRGSSSRFATHASRRRCAWSSRNQPSLDV